MENMMQKIHRYGIVPVVKIDREEDALPLAKALCEGGLPVAEITYRTAAASGAIRAIAKAYPDMILGAGTVLTTGQVDSAVEAGAHFIVSPGLNPGIVRYCQEKGVPILPGVSSASEIEVALELGLTELKFFPAEQSGGLAKIKALCAPYSSVRFMPTGGIGLHNMNDYLAFDKIIACGGSFMVNPADIAAGDFAKVTALTRQAVQAMLGLRLEHIGINAANETEARETARLLSRLFLLGTPDENAASLFVERQFEVMKAPGRGKNGHIALLTNSVERAMDYLERQGEAFLPESKSYDEKGRLSAVYLQRELAGFALHLVQKK